MVIQYSEPHTADRTVTVDCDMTVITGDVTAVNSTRCLQSLY